MANEKKPDDSRLSDDVSIAGSIFNANEASHEVPLIPVKEANAQMLDEAKNHIGVEKTGHGYYAEYHHAATYNQNAAEARSDGHATRFDSYERGSPDIGDESGGLYNLKFCATPMETLKAALEKSEYTGQILVPPSNQFQEIQSLKNRLYTQAIENGDTEYAHRIENLQVQEHIESHGITSDPLTYDGAKQGADLVRDGGVPDSAHPYGMEDLGGHSADAAALALAVNLLPGIKDALQGKKSITEVSKEFGTILKTRGFKVGGEAFAKSALSGGLAGTLSHAMENSEQFDSTGAVLIVTLSFEIGKHAIALKNGQIDIDEFKRLTKKTVFDKGSSILLTSGAVALLGPAGLITPIIVGQLVANAKIRVEVSSAMDGVFSQAETLIRKQLEILAASQETFAYAQDTSHAYRSTSAYADDGISAGENTIEVLDSEYAKQEKLRQRLLANKLNKKTGG